MFCQRDDDEEHTANGQIGDLGLPGMAEVQHSDFFADSVHRMVWCNEAGGNPRSLYQAATARERRPAAFCDGLSQTELIISSHRPKRGGSAVAGKPFKCRESKFPKWISGVPADDSRRSWPPHLLRRAR
jgi:hypothetical protein